MGVFGIVILIVEMGAAEVIVEDFMNMVGFGEGIEGGVFDTNLSQNFTPMLQ